jgi:hypothetical protein
VKKGVKGDQRGRGGTGSHGGRGGKEKIGALRKNNYKYFI